MTKPMNPIMPDTATAAPTAKATCSSISRFVFSISKPQMDCLIFPNNKAFSGFANLIKSIIDYIMNGATPITFFQVAPPTSQTPKCEIA